MIRRRLGLVIAAGLFVAACGRSEDANSTNTPAQQASPPAAETPPPAASAAAATPEVANYPTQVVQSGTLKITQQVKVHQAADPDSTMLTRLGPGTVVEKKASYGDWMLVHWPSGVGQTSPGWVQVSLLAPVIVDAGVPDAAPPPDGGPADAGGAKIIPRPTLGSEGTAKPTTTTPPPNTTTKRPTFKITPK